MKGLKMLKELFTEELKDTYNAEKQLESALPKLAKEASSAELKDALESHLEETRAQIERLEKVFAEIELEPKGRKCKGIEGIIEEGKSMLKELEAEGVTDAGIIAGAQKAEHYEIATYGTLAAWARKLGLDEAAELLEETLEEEKAADRKLSEIAESLVNEAAAEGEEESESVVSRGTR